MSRGFRRKKDPLFTSLLPPIFFFPSRKNRLNRKRGIVQSSSIRGYRSSDTSWLGRAEWSNVCSPNRISMALDRRHADTDPKRRNISQAAASLCLHTCWTEGIRTPQTAFNHHRLLLPCLNQTCPWKSPRCMDMGLITSTSRAQFKAALKNVHLEMQ